MTDDARQARRRQRTENAIRALAKSGNPKKAAASLGIAESTLRKWVAEYLTENGYESAVQAAYLLDRGRVSA